MLSVRPGGVPLDADKRNVSKTPGRALVKSRNTLQENTARNAPATVGKGKKVAINTPFALKTTHTAGKLGGATKPKDTPAIRPLGDKTPFPNRTTNRGTPSNSGEKVEKPALPAGLVRPSSARKHVRLPHSASKNPQTPVTGGQHWDVSDIDIDVHTAVNESIEEEDYSEIEYMPPKVEEIPYEPPFEMPDYKEVGKTLFTLMQSFPISDDPPISSEMSFTLDDSEKDFFTPIGLSLPALEDYDPFALVKSEVENKLSNAAVQTRKVTTAAKPPQRSAVRPTPLTTRAPVVPRARAPSTTQQVPISSTARPAPPATRPAASKATTRTPAVQSTARAPVSRTTTRPPSVARSTPSMRVGTLVPPRPATSAMTRTTPLTSTKATSSKTTAPTSKATTTAPRSRVGTITRVASGSNSRVTIPKENNNLENAKKDLEGFIIFEDAFCEVEDFRFDV